LPEIENQRSESRYQWLQLIVHVAESGSTSIEPVYQAVFASLKQVAIFLACIFIIIVINLFVQYGTMKNNNKTMQFQS